MKTALESLSSMSNEALITLNIVTLESVQPVYLTGSRFFGCADEHSDWDFFTQDTEAMRVKLIKLGFSKVYIAYSDGPNTNAVYALSNLIHVQLSNNLAAKLYLHEDTCFHALIRSLHPDKITARWAWRAAYNFLLAYPPLSY